MKTRQLKILNYLLVQDDYVPAQILADKFDVTPKTIYIDINVLRDELKSYNLEIDKRPYRGIKVIGKKQDINKALEKANTLKEIETDNKFDIDVRRRNLFINIIVKGKGVSFMENQVGWHGKAPNDEQYEIAMKDLEKAGEALCQK